MTRFLKRFYHTAILEVCQVNDTPSVHRLIFTTQCAVLHVEQWLFFSCDDVSSVWSFHL